MKRFARRLILALLAGVALPSAHASSAPWPEALAGQVDAFVDDPQALLGPERQRADAAQGEARVWRLISVARVENTLELDEAVPATLARAAEALATIPAPDPSLRLWLRATELRHASVVASGPALLPALANLRQQLPVGPSVLRCELLDTETWLLDALGSLDEAWRSAEALDTCGADTGWPFFQAQAALMQGQIASQHGQDEAMRARAVAHFERARDRVAPGPGRYLRSLVAYSAGISLGLLGLTEPALAHLRQALAISVDLQDAAGIAAARIEIARFSLDAGRPAEALASLDIVERLLTEQGAGAAERLIHLHALRLRALARLRRPELAKLIERTARLDVNGLLPADRRDLVLARAEAQAALGRYAEAYASMRQARELDDESRALGRDAQVLQLQARYDTAQRDAEIVALRHDQETTRLQVQAQAATQRGLWAAVLALLAGVVAAGMLGWRSLKRRRELTALALRDELTGLPNRRAIEAYARAQLDQARRLGLPFALALIDLDHFKQVNDRFGHPIGDALLRVLGQVGPTALRASDRLGRWGGEEFMLVLPGTRADELAGVFDRLLAAFAQTRVDGLPAPHGVSFSMGASVLDETSHDHPDADFSTLLERADRRLYQAKDAGRSTWR